MGGVGGCSDTLHPQSSQKTLNSTDFRDVNSWCPALCSLSSLWPTNVMWRRSASCRRRARWKKHSGLKKVLKLWTHLTPCSHHTLCVIRKSSQISLLMESAWLRRALWPRRESYKSRLRWAAAALSPALSLGAVPYCVLHAVADGVLLFRRAIGSSPPVLRPRWRARRFMMFSTGSTWPCPPREMRR